MDEAKALLSAISLSGGVGGRVTGMIRDVGIVVEACGGLRRGHEVRRGRWFGLLCDG